MACDREPEGEPEGAKDRESKGHRRFSPLISACVLRLGREQCDLMRPRFNPGQSATAAAERSYFVLRTRTKTDGWRGGRNGALTSARGQTGKCAKKEKKA